MTFSEAVDIVSSVRMRPGFPYGVKLRMQYGALVVAIDAPNVDRPDERVTIYTPSGRACADLKHMNTREFLKLIQETIQRAIAHEVDEFIEVDGKRVFDPHAAEPSRFRMVTYFDEMREIPNDLIKMVKDGSNDAVDALAREMLAAAKKAGTL